MFVTKMNGWGAKGVGADRFELHCQGMLMVEREVLAALIFSLLCERITVVFKLLVFDLRLLRINANTNAHNIQNTHMDRGKKRRTHTRTHTHTHR